MTEVFDIYQRLISAKYSDILPAFLEAGVPIL